MSQQNERSFSTTASRGQWKESDRVNAGNHAAQALNSPILGMVFDLLSQKYYADWLMSEDKELKARESCWYRRMALTEVMKDMADMVEEAQAIIAAQQARNDPAEAEKQRLDEQGYNLNFNQEMS